MNDFLNEEDVELDLDEAVEEKFLQLSLIIDQGQIPIRIDKFLVARLEGATRNRIQTSIDEDMIAINGKPVKQNYKIKGGDFLEVYTFRQPDSTEIIPQDIPLTIAFEDDDILLINKPPNMVVHPGSGNPSGTLINAVAFYLKIDTSEVDSMEALKDNNSDEEKNKLLPRVGLVHRIDKNTSGLILLGKNENAMYKLAEQFKDHTVKRHYTALVWGDVELDEGTITGHIGRDQRFRKKFDIFPEGDYGKHAITHYKVLERFNYTTLVECILETGRTHQIRVHMKHLGHPLFNDSTYGGDRIVKGTVYTKYKQFVDNAFKLCPRQALHARTLGFVHPTSGKEVFFESNLPQDMEDVIDKWRKYIVRK
jgi:23S rRNA pseudouridine1911/1915/1917 synthase